MKSKLIHISTDHLFFDNKNLSWDIPNDNIPIIQLIASDKFSTKQKSKLLKVYKKITFKYCMSPHFNVFK